MYYYIHFPFCQEKCTYCRFPSIGGISSPLIPRYLCVLREEISSFLASHTDRVESIYFGGGTPSLMPNEALTEIISLFSQYVTNHTPEITLETTPENVTPENVLLWHQAGINRLSLGVQTLCDAGLESAGRKGRSEIIPALKTLAGSQFDNISLDFIFGLPYAKFDTTLNDIKTSLALCPQVKHISVYLLEDYFTSGEDGGFQSISYPKDFDTSLTLSENFQGAYLQVLEYLSTQGYHQYEISNFAQDGYQSHHNKSYWYHRPVKGFGLGAHSYLEASRFANAEDFLGYFQGKEAYRELLTSEQIRIEKILFGLRTSGISFQMISPDGQKHVGALVAQNLLTQNGDLLKPTFQGTLVLDSLVSFLIE